MQRLKTITIGDILYLLKKHLDLDITRATLYHYMKARGFPPNTGLGRPRRWRKDRVEKWIAEQIKNSERS